MFSNKKIVVGITGGIAAYKSCEIIRTLIKMNAEVKVVMTEAATHFIAPLTFETLSGNSVYIHQFNEITIHIDLARWADTIIVCPATANTISKIAHGIADNLLTTIILAAEVPVVVCPAMNKAMYANHIFQKNMNLLNTGNYLFIKPGKGFLACNEEGWGRLADESEIIDGLKRVLLGKKELSGKKVVVTASRTEESLDPVRVITNHSTGKMGFALAEKAALHGADVILISGPNQLSPYSHLDYMEVQTAEQMAKLVFEHSESADVVIMAAAVADFRPKYFHEQKMKKNNDDFSVKFERTVDILYELGRQKKDKFLIGFALETEYEIENAIRKLESKNLDLIVLNNPLDGFAGDNNRVTLIDRNRDVIKLPGMSKMDVAEQVVSKIIQLFK